MKEIKKRASDDIRVKNVRSVRNRTIAKRHILYTQGGKQSAVVPNPQLIRGCRNQNRAHTENIRSRKSMGRFWVDSGSWSVKGKAGGGKVYTAYGIRYAMGCALRGAALVST